MNIMRLDDRVSAAPQIAPEDLAHIAALGFCAVMCNRPDGEEMHQPPAAMIAAAAAEQGLAFAHVPVISGQLTPADVQAMADALAHLPTPVLLYCRSGARSRLLYGMASQLSGPARE